MLLSCSCPKGACSGPSLDQAEAWGRVHEERRRESDVPVQCVWKSSTDDHLETTWWLRPAQEEAQGVPGHPHHLRAAEEGPRDLRVCGGCLFLEWSYITVRLMRRLQTRWRRWQPRRGWLLRRRLLTPPAMSPSPGQYLTAGKNIQSSQIFKSGFSSGKRRLRWPSSGCRGTAGAAIASRLIRSGEGRFWWFSESKEFIIWAAEWKSLRADV